jgi:O-antigen/teichoic acid export membrane protein
MVLSLAQVWHAISGYIIFISGYHLLPLGTYSDFILVVWTMTTLEILVVDGVPRSLTWFVAKDAQHANALVRRGLFLTLLLAFALALVIALLAPFIATQVWGDANLTTPLRVASLDFLAFAPFAVMVQILNGLRRYTLQAVTWFSYSTSKVVFVLVMLATVGGVQGAILGYVLASLTGSLVAMGLGRRALPKFVAASEVPTARSLFRLGLPFAALSLSLMAFLNADLWVVKPHETALRASAYAAAATLGRALFFIFRAFGDALSSKGINDGNDA